MAALSSALEAFVVDGSGGSSPRLTVDLMGVCNLVSRTGGGVRMLIMCLFSSFAGVSVVFGVICDWVDLRLSLARCLRRMALFLSVRMSLLTVFCHNMLRVFLVDGLIVALAGKRLEAIRSPSARRSYMVSALSSICFCEGSFVVLWDGGSVWVGFLSVGRSLVRSICTRAARNFVSPCSSSAHKLSKG